MPKAILPCLLGLLTLAGCQQRSEVDPPGSISEELILETRTRLSDGESLSLSLTEAQVRDAGRWWPGNPLPISAPHAIRLAESRFRESDLPDSEEGAAMIRRCCFRRVGETDQWVWTVSFGASDDDFAWYGVHVLLDGTVVLPTRRPFSLDDVEY